MISNDNVYTVFAANNVLYPFSGAKGSFCTRSTMFCKCIARFVLWPNKYLRSDGGAYWCQITLSDIERFGQFINKQNEQHPITVSHRQGRIHHIFEMKKAQKGAPFFNDKTAAFQKDCMTLESFVSLLSGFDRIAQSKLLCILQLKRQLTETENNVSYHCSCHVNTFE